MRKFVFVDTETTGLDPATNSILSIALIVDNKDYYWKVKPTTPVSPSAAKINGYTEEGWKDAIEFSSIADELNRLWDGCIMVAHKASFDDSFIRKEYARLNKRCTLDYHLMDTCVLALEHLDIPSVTLVKVASHLGLETTGAHNALVDVKLCKGIFEKLFRGGE